MIDDAERWQLEGDSPDLYERYLVPAVTLPWAVDFVQRVGVRSGCWMWRAAPALLPGSRRCASGMVGVSLGWM